MSTPSSSSTRDPAEVRGGMESLSLEGASAASAPPAEPLDLVVARRMFYGGFAALPFLWLVSWWHYRKVAKQPDAHPMLAVYVNRSLIGAVCGFVALLAWITYVQLTWRTWGEFGRSLMLVMPEPDEL